MPPGTAAQLLTRIRAAEHVLFIVGAPLTAPSVPGVAGMVEAAKNTLTTVPDTLSSSGTLNEEYEAVFSALRYEGRVDDFLREQVAKAYRGQGETPDKMEEDVAGWKLTSGVASLGCLLAKRPEKFRGVVTTNFDPLIEVATRRAGGTPCSLSFIGDGDIAAPVNTTGAKIVHVHGYWSRKYMANTETELQRHRPTLAAQLKTLMTGSLVVFVAVGGWKDIVHKCLVEVVKDRGRPVDVAWACYGEASGVPEHVADLAAETSELLIYERVDVHKLLADLASDDGPPKPPNGNGHDGGSANRTPGHHVHRLSSLCRVISAVEGDGVVPCSILGTCIRPSLDSKEVYLVTTSEGIASLGVEQVEIRVLGREQALLQLSVACFMNHPVLDLCVAELTAEQAGLEPEDAYFAFSERPIGRDVPYFTIGLSSDGTLRSWSLLQHECPDPARPVFATEPSIHPDASLLGAPVFHSASRSLAGIVVERSEVINGDSGTLVGAQRVLPGFLNSILDSDGQGGARFPVSALDGSEAGLSDGSVVNLSDFPLHGVQIDLLRCIDEFRHDLRDDWFPDPLDWDDQLAPELLAERLRTAGNGLLSTTPARPLFVPKKGPTYRTALLSDFLPRFELHCLVSTLAKRIGLEIPWRVFSCRPADGKGLGGGMFVNPLQQWKKFSYHVEDERQRGRMILCADVANYYDSISTTRLEEKLLSLLKKHGEPVGGVFCGLVGRIIEILRLMCPEGRGGVGVPQNRDASAFLANVFLFDVDETMAAQFDGYSRYLDDIRVACKDEEEAWDASRALKDALYECGLQLNSAKTHFWKPSIGDAFDSAEPSFSQDLDFAKVDSLLRSGRRRTIVRAVGMLKRIFFSAVARVTDATTGDDSEAAWRAFSFSIERLSRLAGEPMLNSNVEWDSVAASALAVLSNEPSTGRAVVRLLRRLGGDRLTEERKSDLEARTLRNARRGWLGYLLWLACVEVGLDSIDLTNEAKRLVQDPGRFEQESSAAACIYLAERRVPGFERLISAALRGASHRAVLFDRAAAIGLRASHVPIPAEADPRVNEWVSDLKLGPCVYLKPEWKPELSQLLRDVPVSLSLGV